MNALTLGTQLRILTHGVPVSDDVYRRLKQTGFTYHRSWEGFAAEDTAERREMVRGLGLVVEQVREAVITLRDGSTRPMMISQRPINTEPRKLADDGLTGVVV